MAGISLLLSAVWTFPLIFDLRHHLFGIPGDNLGHVWRFWWLKSQWLEGGTANFFSIVFAPFGEKLSQIPGVPITDTLGTLLSLLYGEVVAFNLLVFLSFPAAFMTQFLLAYHFTRNLWGSALAALIFAFSPFHFAHAYEHITLTSVHWLPIFFLFLLRFGDSPTFGRGLLLALSFSIVAMENLYFGYFVLLMSVAFLAYLGVYRHRRGLGATPSLRTLLLAITSVAIIPLATLPVTVPIFRLLQNEASLRLVERPYFELFIYSAKIWDYLLPSVYHPILGRYVKGLVDALLFGSNYSEQTLYLGLIPLALAILGVRAWWKGGLSKRSGYLAGYCFVGAIVALVISGPPFLPLGGYEIVNKEIVTPFKLYLPSHFLYFLLPMFRVYARLGVILLLFVSLLAGIGLASLLRSGWGPAKKGLLVGLAFGIVAFEFAVSNPTIDVREVPEVYRWLQAQPHDILVAEYPIGSKIHTLPGRYLFWQRVHRQKLLNEVTADSETARFREKVIDLSDPQVAGLLRGRGVDLVIVHRDYYERAGLAQPQVASPFILVKKFGPAEVYRVGKPRPP